MARAKDNISGMSALPIDGLLPVQVTVFRPLLMY